MSTNLDTNFHHLIRSIAPYSFIFVLVKVYTKCGRRALPTMMMGSAAVFIDCDECWKLLVVTRKGSLFVWDLFNRNCLLHDTLACLITSDLNSSAKDAGNGKNLSLD